MIKLLLGIAIGVAIVIVALQFDAAQKYKNTRTMPLPVTTGHQEYKNSSDEFVGTTFTGIGGAPHPPFAVEPVDQLSADELKKAIHDSLRTKAADQNQSGDW